MIKLKQRFLGLLLCSAIASVAWFCGEEMPIIGAPLFAIVFGMIIGLFHNDRTKTAVGITFVSKKVLQYAVILLGFGLNISQVIKVGITSLPVILSTISVALMCAYLCRKWFHIETNRATLIGVGSSICGGSAIAATAPVIDASNDDVSEAISVIFIFNVLAVIIFPTLASWLHLSNDGFALFVGTAVNDTSSVTATATIWDSIYNAQTLNGATVVKLTRTLAIIPITLALSIYQMKKNQHNTHQHASFPKFILYFALASVVTTLLSSFGVNSAIFAPLKILSKFFIVMAMSAIGLNTNIVQLVKKGGKSLIVGGLCWVVITVTSLIMQWALQLW